MDPRPNAAPLSGPADLIGRAWDVFKQRFLTYWGVGILGVLKSAAFAAAWTGAGWAAGRSLPARKHEFLACGIGLAVLSVFWGLAVTAAALTEAVADDSIDAGEALRRGRRRALPALGLWMWMGVLISGGYLLFFVPGILFQVWFSFAPLALAREGVGGWEALFRSQGAMRGRTWPVAVRLFVMWLVFALISAVPGVGQILGFLLAPWPLVHARVLYDELRSAPPSDGAGPRAAVALAALAGFLWIPLAAGSAIARGAAAAKRGLKDGTLSAAIKRRWERPRPGSADPLMKFDVSIKVRSGRREGQEPPPDRTP